MMRPARALTAFYLIQGGAAIAFSIVYTLNIYYQTTIVGMTAFQLVIVGTALEATTFFSEVPTGIVADLYSRRLSVIIGYLLLGLTFVLEGLFPFFLTIFAVQIVRALGYTFISGALQAWIVDELRQAGNDDALGGVLLRGAQIGQIGSIAGVIAGIALALVSIQGAIVIGGLVMLALGLVLLVVMPETGFVPTPREERQTFRQVATTFRSGLRVIRGSRVLLLAAAIVIFGGLYSEGLDRLWPKHLVDNAGLNTLAIPAVVLLGAIGIAEQLVSLGVAELVRRRVDTRRARAVVRAMGLLAGIQLLAMIGFILAGQAWIAAGLLVIISAMRGSFAPLFDTWVNPHIDSSVRATTLSMLAQTDALGQIGGGPVIGAVGSLAGVRAALALSALAFAPLLLVLRQAGILEAQRTLHTQEASP